MAEHSSGELPTPGDIAARRAALLNASLSTVTVDDMAAIEAAMIEKAKGCDKKAAQLAVKAGRLKFALREFDQPTRSTPLESPWRRVSRVQRYRGQMGQG